MKRKLVLAVVLLALVFGGCGVDNGVMDGVDNGGERSVEQGGQDLPGQSVAQPEDEASGGIPAGERQAEIVAVVSRNCNYVYHMLAVSGTGYVNDYGQRYQSLHSQADLEILKGNEQHLSVSGGEYQGDLYFLCVVLPASLDDTIPVAEYYEALGDLFATGELERNFAAYEELYRQSFSAYTDVSLESFREFYQGNERLKEELAQICGVMGDNYAIYLDEVWEASLEELSVVAEELNREFARQDYVNGWEEALGCKYGQEAFYALMTNSMENGPNCIDISQDKDVFYHSGEYASTAKLISHEFGIYLLRDLLADTEAFHSYDYYDFTEALAEYYNTLVSGGHSDWDWGSEYIGFYARLAEEEPGITPRELFFRAVEEYLPGAAEQS